MSTSDLWRVIEKKAGNDADQPGECDDNTIGNARIDSNGCETKDVEKPLGAEEAVEQHYRVFRSSSGAVQNLLTARNAGSGNHGVTCAADGREQSHFTDLHRQIVMLTLKAE